MEVATTIQISSQEDQEITSLKEKLGLPSKRAVVMEGIRNLGERLQEETRQRRLREASFLVRRESQKVNREWAHRASALRVK